MIALITLPEETLVHILRRASPVDIQKCRQVCRFLWTLIDSSTELQYLIELYTLGYVPPARPHPGQTFTEALELLRTHRSRSSCISKLKPKRYTIPRTNAGYTSTYDFYGGIYARGSTANSLSNATRRLELYQLASVNKGTEFKQWTHHDLGVDTRDFAMEPDFDLLVLLEQAEQTVIVGAAQGTPNVMQHFNVNLRSLETCAAHPDAARPILRHSLRSFAGMSWRFYFQIVGRYLAVLFLIGVEQRDANQTSQLRVWDWTTGNVVTYIDVISGESRAFAFLSDHLIAVPRHVAPGNQRVVQQGILGTLNLYAFDPPTNSSPPPPARHIASLRLPPLPQNVMSIPKLSCRSDPAPSPSTQSATWDRGRPKLFELAPTNRVLCLQADLTTIEVGRGEFLRAEGTLFVPFTDMLDAVAHLHKQSEPVEIPWEAWGHGSSWMDTTDLHTGNECYVYGQRVVTTGAFDLEGPEEDDMPQRGTLFLLDFDPVRLSTYDKSFNRTTETLLTARTRGDALWDMFLSENTECKANARFGVQTARIKQNHPAFYVMIDDEHVVIVTVMCPPKIQIGFTNRFFTAEPTWSRVCAAGLFVLVHCGGRRVPTLRIRAGFPRQRSSLQNGSLCARNDNSRPSANRQTRFHLAHLRLQSVLQHTTSMATGDIGLIGLAVMGQNLILNMNDKGFTVVAYNRTTSKVDSFLQNEAKGTNIIGAYSIDDLVAKLKRPRKIIMLVKAGDAVDSFIQQLIPHLEQGDIIIDGGNSYYPDSIRRTKELEAKGLLFVGSGVSGGEEGARNGPSLMPGGSTAAWDHIKEIFQKTAAQVGNDPCCDWMGPTGSGHYVKMVHNGIEYGDMQLIAEAYDILKRGLGLHEDEIASIFEKWNKGVLDSFLIEITTNVLKYKDADGEPMVTKILDKAGQKGTGKWTAVAALDAGTPVTLIGEAVFARCLSAIKEERTRASKVLAGPQREEFRGDKQQFIDDLEQALYASKIISYTQGFMLMRETAKELKWDLNYAGIARIWRGGCIIKSVFLNDITKAYEKNHDLESLLFDDFFIKAIHNAQPGWRRVIAQAVLWGIPTPAFSTALAFFDGYRSEIVSANILQGQRDYFGAHTFRVLPGKENELLQAGKDIHINWTGRGGNVSASTYIA
ncbi:hypothetical protein FRC10_011124 [Ceratobasidium sp. 414]|nr:hypothetical protein FRC10_011124 [Ceratobasidium sp. 414]